MNKSQQEKIFKRFYPIVWALSIIGIISQLFFQVTGYETPTSFRFFYSILSLIWWAIIYRSSVKDRDRNDTNFDNSKEIYPEDED